MNIIFFDSETTGFPRSNDAPLETQPHIVQLAALLTDPKGRELARMNVIVKPDGWTIPDEAAAVHGITTEKALAEGIAEDHAICLFLNIYALAGVRVAHNEAFDSKIVAIAMYRSGISTNSLRGEWHDMPAICTAALSAPICKLPATQRMTAVGRNHYKTPKLSEAWAHFNGGKTLEGAHDAMVDVLACRDIYFNILNMKEAA